MITLYLGVPCLVVLYGWYPMHQRIESYGMNQLDTTWGFFLINIGVFILASLIIAGLTYTDGPGMVLFPMKATVFFVWMGTLARLLGGPVYHNLGGEFDESTGEDRADSV